MSEHLDPDLLLAFALGELDDASLARVRAHAASCGRCAGELAWAEHDVAALGSLDADLGPLPAFETVMPRSTFSTSGARWGAVMAAVAVAAVLAGLVIRGRGAAPIRAEDPQALPTSPTLVTVGRSEAVENDDAVCAPVRTCSRAVEQRTCAPDPE